MRYIIIISILLLAGCSKNLQRTERPAHYGEESFVNPYLKSDKSFWDVVKMRFFDEDWIEWDGMEYKVPKQITDTSVIYKSSTDTRITWIGHSTFLIQTEKANILTDPVFADVVSPVSFIGPERVHPPALIKEELPKIDFVLVSHNHYDHLDAEFVEYMGNKTKWIVPLGIKEFLLDYDIKSENIFELDWGEKTSLSGFEIIATPAQHFSGRWLNDRNKTLWCSFAVISDKLKFWFGGDTGYNEFQFKEIGTHFSGFDFAFIPIGANRPRWFMKDVHVNPEEAVIIHKEVKSKKSFGMHWGTFRNAAEAIDEPVIELEKAKSKYNLNSYEFEVFKVGETKIIK